MVGGVESLLRRQVSPFILQIQCLDPPLRVSYLAIMAKALLNVTPALPAIRHNICGMHHVDAAVASIEVLMHRRVSLEKWSLRAASNAFWRLYWPLSRGGVVTFQGMEHELEPGWLYLISPHTAFDSRCRRPFAKWYLHFNAGGLPYGCSSGIARLRPAPRMRTLLASTCPNHRRSKADAEQQSHPLESLELVLLTLQLALPRFERQANTESRLPSCVTWLQEHLREKVTLADLARFADVSPRTLSNLFVSEVGFPPMRYLLELRLNRVMTLLRHTDYSIEQIAEECGFPNRYYLTRMLSKYRRTTPAAFRALGSVKQQKTISRR